MRKPSSLLVTRAISLLAPGSPGTMTAPEPLAAGERWRVEVSGVDLPGLGVVLTD